MCRSEILAAIEAGQLKRLLHNDQLRKAASTGAAFGELAEPPIGFPPTFKFDVGPLGGYDTSPKQRKPAWCDRILVGPATVPAGAGWLSNSAKPASDGWPVPTCRPVSYRSSPLLVSSDHKPVTAVFNLQFPCSDSLKIARNHQQNGPNVSAEWRENNHPFTTSIEGSQSTAGTLQTSLASHAADLNSSAGRKGPVVSEDMFGMVPFDTSTCSEARTAPPTDPETTSFDLFEALGVVPAGLDPGKNVEPAPQSSSSETATDANVRSAVGFDPADPFGDVDTVFSAEIEPVEPRIVLDLHKNSFPERTFPSETIPQTAVNGCELDLFGMEPFQ
eukprot:SAG31_NODE_2875_length_4971_cov_2.727011_4_plen_332_part_00